MGSDAWRTCPVCGAPDTNRRCVREDYDIGLSDTGMLEIDFTAKCGTCGAEWQYNATIDCRHDKGGISTNRNNAYIYDGAEDVLVDYMEAHRYKTYDEAINAFLIEFGSVKTYKGGWFKIHLGCGGAVRYIENMDTRIARVFDRQCMKCGKMLWEDEIEMIYCRDQAVKCTAETFKTQHPQP